MFAPITPVAINVDSEILSMNVLKVTTRLIVTGGSRENAFKGKTRLL